MFIYLARIRFPDDSLTMAAVVVESFHDQMVGLVGDLVAVVGTFLVLLMDSGVVVVAFLLGISFQVVVEVAFLPLVARIVTVEVVVAFQAFLVVLAFFLVAEAVVATFRLMAAVVDVESFLVLVASEASVVALE